MNTTVGNFWLEAATRLILTKNWVFRNELIKSILIDVLFRYKHVSIYEIVENLKYIDKKAWFLLKALEVPMKNQEKATYENEIR